MEVAGYSKAFSMDQGRVLGNDQLFQALYNAPLTDGKRNGICTGLSMIWLARRMMFHDESAQDRFAALATGAGFRWGGQTQDIHVRDGAQGGVDAAELYDNWYGGALQVYALKINRRSVVDNPWTGSVGPLVDVVKHAGTYCLYNIGLQTSTGSAGHMCASYSSHGTLGMNRHFYFFDPNMGEYRISAKDIEDFLLGVANAYLGAFQGLNYFDCFEVVRG